MAGGVQEGGFARVYGRIRWFFGRLDVYVGKGSPVPETSTAANASAQKPYPQLKTRNQKPETSREKQETINALHHVHQAAPCPPSRSVMQNACWQDQGGDRTQHRPGGNPEANRWFL